MSYPPPPPPYYGPPPPWPHPPPPGHYPPPPPGHFPHPPPHHEHYPAYYVPVMPVPGVPMQPPAEQPSTNPTYITNYIYHGENSNQTSNPPTDQVQIAETSGEYDWVPTTAMVASHLTGRAVAGGHEGWDGSPLWVIRSWHCGDLIPGKFSVRHNAACVTYDGKEIPVQNIEVLCARPQSLRWVPASNGLIPPGAISGGQTATGETLYIGRARHQLSITPGKVHPSHNSCYIAFSGAEVAHKMYDVLCRVS